MLGSTNRERFSIKALQVGDAFLVFVAFWMGDKLRPIVRSLLGRAAEGEIGLGEIAWLLLIVVPLMPAVLKMLGFYQNIMRKTLAQSFLQLLRCLMITGTAVAVAVIFFKTDPASRIVLASALLLTTFLLLIRDFIVRQALKKAALEEGRRERVILAGNAKDIAELAKTMPEQVTDYWQVVAEFDFEQNDMDDFEGLLVDGSVERVIIAARHTVFQQISRAVEICEKQGIEAWVSAGFIRTQVSRPTFDNLGGRPMLVLRATPELSWALLVKAAMDRIGALFFILVTFPLWLFAMAGIKLSSPGAPVFFRQERAGKYGKPFEMWKFRTMVPNAEDRLDNLKKEMGNEMTGPVFKLEEDPRVFPFARFLRKWSIDEFPQMFNVLAGEMSLVGPRPLPVYEVKKIEKSEHRRRLSVKPGITCIWQVRGRNEISDWEDWVEMDLQYIDNWSLLLDFKLVLMTIPAVLLQRGAK